MLNAEPRATAEIHPDDAAARAIGDGRRSRCTTTSAGSDCTASITDNVPAGTVAVPFGRWGTDPTSGGANRLTSDSLGDLANGPTFCDNLVEVELAQIPVVAS